MNPSNIADILEAEDSVSVKAGYVAVVACITCKV